VRTARANMDARFTPIKLAGISRKRPRPGRDKRPVLWTDLRSIWNRGPEEPDITIPRPSGRSSSLLPTKPLITTAEFAEIIERGLIQRPVVLADAPIRVSQFFR
jgi:hypothetical protein